MTGQRSTLRDRIRTDGFVIQPTVGNSMEPMLHNRRSLVKIESVDGELPKYAVPLYQRPNGQYVLHRIVKVRAHDYLIIGDNRHRIEKVPKQWVVGVLTEYAGDGVHWHTVNDPEYREYVAKHMAHFWPRHYLKWFAMLPGRVIRKLKRICGKIRRKP